MARLTYKQAGVDIEAGDSFVRRITPLVRSTFRPEVLTDLGSFSGLFRLDAGRYKDPVLVSGTDGVGTKLKVAQLIGKHDTVGIDLVAMSVNDVLVCGAEPLFFLDYLATGKLDPDAGLDLIKGIVEGCRSAGCALIGGETAEMPSFYTSGEYDLAGFAVGVVERDQIIDGKKISPGDAVIGLASSGLHSNGYSLARKVIFETAGLKASDTVDEWNKTVGEELLTPTRIYVKPVLSLLGGVEVHGMAHITGGGLTGNVPRILPEGCDAVVRPGSWTVPPVFEWLRKKGDLATEEMFRVFNMGIGWVIILPAAQADKAVEHLAKMGEKPFRIGEVVSGERRVVYA
jgi:phosphoribosylformylglycinamidine cyclo-ligase